MIYLLPGGSSHFPAEEYVRPPILKKIRQKRAKKNERHGRRLIELGGFIEGQLSEESISILKVLPRFRFVKMDNYLKKIAVEAGGIENLRRLQVEKVDTQGNV